MHKKLLGTAIAVLIAILAFDVNAISTIRALPDHPAVIAMAIMAVSVEPAMYSIESAMRILDVKRSTIYKLVNLNRLDARKIGSKTLLTAESVQKLIANAPKAKIAGNGEAPKAKIAENGESRPMLR